MCVQSRVLWENHNKTDFIELKCRLTSEEIQKLCKQRHFTKEQSMLVTGLAMQLIQKAGIHIYYKYGHSTSCMILTIITLGQDVDDWLDELLERQELAKAFIVDCLAGELLLKACKKWGQFLYEQTGKYPGDYHYIEDEDQLSQIENYLGLLDQSEIKVTESGMMIPAKTVLFMTELTDNQKEESSNCLRCKRKETCPFSSLRKS